MREWNKSSNCSQADLRDDHSPTPMIRGHLTRSGERNHLTADHEQVVELIDALTICLDQRVGTRRAREAQCAASSILA